MRTSDGTFSGVAAMSDCFGHVPSSDRYILLIYWDV